MAFIAPADTPAVAEINRGILGRLTPPADDDDLPLGAGDLIEVSVFDVPELSSLKFRIPQSGTITLPLLGSITAAGASPHEVQRSIRTRLQEKYMHDPQVTVFVHEHKSQRISVIGAVRTGGVYPLTGRLRLADALAMAGGLTDEAGNMVYINRRSATEQAMTAVDMEALVGGKDDLNLPLQAGDVVDVPRAGSYYVGGEVEKPGSFLLKGRTTVDQAITAAAGPRDVADHDDVRLYRLGAGGQRQVLSFSLDDFAAGQPAPEVRQHDVIMVGKSTTKAVLYGVRDFIRFGVGATLP